MPGIFDKMVKLWGVLGTEDHNVQVVFFMINLRYV